MWNWWCDYQEKVRQDALKQCIKKSKGVYNEDMYEFVNRALGLFAGEEYKKAFKHEIQVR